MIKILPLVALAWAPRLVFAQQMTNSAQSLSSPAGLSSLPAHQHKYDAEQPYNADFRRLDELLHNKEFADDHKLTDILLRAQDGSLSRVSMKADMSFNGPVIDNPSVADLPNPDRSVGTYSQALTGRVTARYRINSDQTLSIGSGVQYTDPFQGGTNTSASNPFVSYTWANRFGNLQMLTTPGLTYATLPAYTNVGEVGGPTFINSLVMGLGESHYSVSMMTMAMYSFFNRDYIPGVPTASFGHRLGGHMFTGDGNCQQYMFMVAPGLKYSFSDHVEAYTSLNVQAYNLRSDSNQADLWSSTPSMSAGVGYSYDRDIYIAPYLQTYPSIMSPDTTTANVMMVFSLL